MKIPLPPDTNTHIYFRQIVTDSQKLDGRKKYTFFGDSDEYSDERAITVPEQQMVRWLFNQPSVVDLIFEGLNVSSDYEWFLEIREPIIKNSNTKPGDIDILLCNRKDPRCTIVLECKRVKVRFDESRKEYINKVEGLVKGIEQANALSELGFYKCYIFVMIITDGYHLKEEGHMFRRASTESLNKIYNFEGYKNLNESIGIALCPVTQPSGKIIHENHTIAIREHKKACPKEQPGELTENILSHLRKYEKNVS